MKFSLYSYDFFNEGIVTSTFTVDAATAEIGEVLIKKQLSKLLRHFPAGTLMFVPQAFQPNSNIQPWMGGGTILTQPGIPAGFQGGQWNGQAEIGPGNVLGGTTGGYVPNNGAISMDGVVTINVPNNASWTVVGVNGAGSLTTAGSVQLDPGQTLIVSANSSNFTYSNSTSAPISVTSTSAMAPAGV